LGHLDVLSSSQFKRWGAAARERNVLNWQPSLRRRYSFVQPASNLSKVVNEIASFATYLRVVMFPGEAKR